MGQGSGWEGMVLMLCLSLPAGELDLAVQDGERQVRTRRSLPEGFSWGPFQGSIHSEPASPGHGEKVRSNAAGGCRGDWWGKSQGTKLFGEKSRFGGIFPYRSS